MCVCVPEQTAPQSLGHPGTWDPLWAMTAAGHPRPVEGGCLGGFSLGTDLRETQN